MTHRMLLTTALAIAGAVGACAAAEVPVVHDPAPAEADTVHYDLSELWRQGGPDGDALMGWIRTAVGDGAGNAYLLDSGLKHVLVLDADGAPAGTLGREGEGPGEFPNPSHVSWWDEGVLAVSGGRVGALDLIDLAGDPVDTLVLTDEAGDRLMLGIQASRRLGDGVIVNGQMGTGTPEGVKTEDTVGLHAPDGARRALLHAHEEIKPLAPFHFDEGKAVSPWSAHLVVGDRFYIAPERNRYEILVRDAAGEPVLRFGRDFESRPRSERELEEMHEAILGNVREYFPDATADLLPLDRDVYGLRDPGDGTIWVIHARSTPAEREDLLCVYDVFDAGGRWLRRAAVHDPHPGAHRGLIFLPGGRVLRRALLGLDGGVHATGADVEGEFGVVCYRLDRRP